MTSAQQKAKKRADVNDPIKTLAAGKVTAVLAWLSGLAMVVGGLVLLMGDAPRGGQPTEAAVVLAFGLFWVALGIVATRAPRIAVFSLIAFFATLTLLFVAFLGGGSLSGGRVRWVVVAVALVVDLAAVWSFHGAVKASDLPDGSLPSSRPLELAHVAAASQLFCLRNTAAIAWREVKRYFRSPSSYIILALFLLYQGLVFYIAVRYLNDPRAPHGAPMKFFFGGPFWFWPLECFIIAIITMDTLAEEQIRKTVEPMMTAPVHEAELVLGKFLGALGFFFFLWVWTFIYVILLVSHTQGVHKGTILEMALLGGFAGMWVVLFISTRRGASSGLIALVAASVGGLLAAQSSAMSLGAALKSIGLFALPVAALVVRERVPKAIRSARGVLIALFFVGVTLLAITEFRLVWQLFEEAGRNAPKIGPILSGYLGALFIGAAGIALGILYSSLTRDLKLACMLTFVSLFLLIIVKIMLLPELNLIETEWVRKLMEHINFFDYMTDFSRGIVDTRQLTLLGSVVVVCLFGASRAIQSFKWR